MENSQQERNHDSAVGKRGSSMLGSDQEGRGKLAAVERVTVPLCGTKFEELFQPSRSAEDDCLLCQDLGVFCRVGFHPRSASHGQGSLGLVVSSAIHALFAFFRGTTPPISDGTVFTAPDGLLFTNLTATYEAQSGALIVRRCYDDLLTIIDMFMTSGDAGVVFTGGQGMGKTWCSVYMLWHFVHRSGRAVVYESDANECVYVVSADGSTRRQSRPATIVTVEELLTPETVHIYDAQVSGNGSREPVSSRAFLIEFSTRNKETYANALRRKNVRHCVVPSYDESELLSVCGSFGVTPEEVSSRCAVIGPSIRHVLADERTYSAGLEATKRAANRKDFSLNSISRYLRVMQTTGFRVVNGVDERACLMVAKVDPVLRAIDVRRAYDSKFIQWDFASCGLMRRIAGSFDHDDVVKFIIHARSKRILAPAYRTVLLHFFDKQVTKRDAEVGYVVWRRWGQFNKNSRRVQMWNSDMHVDDTVGNTEMDILHHVTSAASPGVLYYCGGVRCPRFDYAAMVIEDDIAHLKLFLVASRLKVVGNSGFCAGLKEIGTFMHTKYGDKSKVTWFLVVLTLPGMYESENLRSFPMEPTSSSAGVDVRFLVCDEHKGDDDGSRNDEQSDDSEQDDEDEDEDDEDDEDDE